MKALVYDGVGKIKVIDKPKPNITSPDQAIVKLTRTTICGTDLHIIKGDVQTVTPGRTLGHEGIGVVEEVGSAVQGFKRGDRVLIGCITGCDTCLFCRKSMRDQCQRGGWQLGNVMDGTQAEYVCIPWATGGLHHIAEGVNERDLLVFSDILPTSYEVGVLRGGIKPGDTVAIVGAGPVGLAAVITAQLYSPKAIVVFDKNDGRLKVAKSLGATDVINSSKGKVRELSKHHFGELDGFDVVIEAVGIPATFQMCQDLVGIGGRIANVGVHGTRVSLDIDKHWPRSISMIINHIRDERLRFD
ncbi:hypothetical protein M433DRAFT_387617 [Acidomyces richmondensis BFW]|nr:MAG: hypothetical protein FE78DRAFT_450163 [Acidomyces sp. 'richmondensis']KYG42839.1 hypothetical protein M433DRAFT_387617 [Acidomyces richmondensis BFW]